MPNRCTVCLSPRRKRLEAMVLGGMTVAAACRALVMPVGPARRHMAAHVERPESPLPPPAAEVETPESAAETFRLAFGMEPQAWQSEYLAETRPLVLVKGRQIGATQAAAALAIHTALSKSGAAAAICSPSMRQSVEVAARVRVGLWEMGLRLVQDSTSLIRLENGSRIFGLPGTARAVRGYALDLLVMDEAAFTDDATWEAAMPTTAATGGRIVVQSTPGLAMGWFHDLVADEADEDWARMRVRSDESTTVDREFMEKARRRLQPEVFAQEYEAVFASGEGELAPSLFDPEKLRALVVPGTRPLFEKWPGDKLKEE